ncbi:putative ubiquitin-like-specific protease 2B [Abeliophyllum distichum]|uniref:Ubiquitin-like-specific protease 2B n=1 Tax=Abeliophyllum distichum TaxID=126358 RepID=A0ABD1SE44_9LAMI
MKSSCNSLDVFEFKEEDELTEMAAKSLSSKYTFLHRVAQEIEIQSKEINHVPCVDIDAPDIDHGCNAAGSFTPLDLENCAKKKMPGVSNVQHVNSRSQEQRAAIRYNKLDCGKDHSNCAFPESLLKDEPAGMASVTNRSISEGSPLSAIAEDDASNDGSSSENCFSGWDMGDRRTEVVFFPDYVDYRGVHYLNTVVIFSRKSVEVKTKTANGNNGTFDIQLEIEDIVKIDSLWSARYETGTINICFISKDEVQNDTFQNTSASEIEGLKFPTFDSDWYEKQEAIKSLDVRYKALWNILLDIGMEACTEASADEKAKLLSRSYFPNFNKPFEEVIYPKGDPDAVSISKRDVDLLRPDTFVNDTIIDFYIKYLKNKQKPEERFRFHFFNSFFFRKMANMDKDPSSAFDGKAAFQRVRKWTRKVNLLEKDFIFIPINYHYHWSLIVICYFGEVAKYEETDKSVRVPCILHMDSIRGSHAGLNDLMQSYLWEEWKERQTEACEDLHAKFRNLKFVSLELPQQQNSYDCGLFLLHYVELFLEEVPVKFSIYNITSSTKFLNADWFPPGEASLKRAHIERLIHDLLENHLEGSSPSCGSYKNCSSNIPETTNDSGNSIEFLLQRTSPFKSFNGSLFCSRSREGFEMSSPLTTSLKNAQCASYSGLVLKEFLEPRSASEPFVNAKHFARESFKKFKRPISPIEEEVEASMCFAYTTSTGTTFQYLDEIRPETSVFIHPSMDFKPESVFQAALKDTATSQATSIYDSDDSSEVEVVKKCQAVGEISFDDKLDRPRCTSAENIDSSTGFVASAPGQMQYAGESRTPVQISGRNYDAYPITTFQKSSPEFYPQENELPSNGGIPHEYSNDCPDPDSGEMLDVSDSECPTRMLEPHDNADLLESSPGLYCHRYDTQEDGIEYVPEIDCPKRMRLTTSA